MNDMVDWLNDNAGAVQAVAALLLVVVTAILAVVTAIYARLVWSQARSAGKLADETTGLVQATQHLVTETRRHTRPYVFVEVVRRGNILDTSVRNTGERGAENLKIETEHDVYLSEDSRGFLGWPLFQQPIPFLPPGRSVSQLVSFHHMAGPSLQRLPPDKRELRYTIHYSDGEEEYHESHVYDLSWLVPVGGDPWPLAGDYLGQLVEEVKKWGQALVQQMEALKEILTARKPGPW
jgi:hypothetical protein